MKISRIKFMVGSKMGVWMEDEEYIQLLAKIETLTDALWKARAEFEFNGLYDDADNIAQALEKIEASK